MEIQKIEIDYIKEQQVSGEISKYFDSNRIICKSSSKILEYVLAKLDINIKTVYDEQEDTRLKHVYNVVYPKDGSAPYRLDLQRDLMNIHFNQFPKKFGMRLTEDKEYVISLQEQKLMHQKLGYVTRENPYTDEYVYNFILELGNMDNFYDKVDFVMDNIEPKEFPNVGYWERRWNHERFLSKVFPINERKKILAAEFYKQNSDGEKVYINGFYVEGGPRKKSVYIYSPEEYKYNVYSLEEYLKLAEKEEIQCKQEALKPERIK